MNKLMVALLFMAGFVLVLGGVAYIDESPLTLEHTLTGFSVSLMGVLLWIVAMLWSYMFIHKDDI